MIKFKKIAMVLMIIIISLSNINAVYDPNNEYTDTNPDEFIILNEDNNDVGFQVQAEYKAKVIESLSVYTSELEGAKYQNVRVKIIDKGEHYGKEYEAEYLLQILDTFENKELEVGRTVYVMFYKDSPTTQSVIVKDVDRIPYLLLLVAIFIATIIIIGKKQGLKTVIALTITFLSIVYILIPAILEGYGAITMSVVICVFISIITLTLVGGFNRKTLVSIIGTVFGVIVSALLALFISYIARITGLGNQDGQMLIYLAEGTFIDVYGLFFAGIIIGAVGATMDISMSISSTMNEVEKTSKNISTKDLIKSGLNVGKDSMGTMANTLIFAYVGQSLILIIIFMLNNPNWVSIANSDFISSEILRGLCGTIGMILAIPLTAYIYGLLHDLSKKKSQNN